MARSLPRRRGGQRIGGTTEFDHHDAALAAIMAEWSSRNDFATHVAHLRRDLSGALSGNIFLKGAGPNATVFDDGAVDTLLCGSHPS